MSDDLPDYGSVDRMEFLLNLRRRGISDAAVLRAMDEVPREHFVTPEFLDQAYTDSALPIACGQSISQPYVVAYMTEKLEVEPHHRVLEVGTGSGYQAAVLSRIARSVFTVERFRTLYTSARVRIETLGFKNVAIFHGDGRAGLPEHAPFDRIIVTAATDAVPEDLLAQLADEGIAILPVGPHDEAQRLVKLTKDSDGLRREELIGVRFVPLLPGKAREL